ncbi:short-chain dehydrogenase/reductase [Enemella evansiae]|uniref:Short-chain dehydrogenase/reductase n=1 Tax=Enemella evansiae TaxID=2016499 RepID=A0A255GPV3_9ACTN|nr:SDR family NAD(P)-dependent oxidoreductase [Enemella evansiae]OYO17611.1 short-chain dehydrogenase/reductase [Enemella evansiae]
MAVWFITGTSSGFGRAIAEQAREQGHTVVATARDTGAIADFTDALRLDVTDQASIDAAVGEAIARHGRIDVLVNNAGHGHLGAAEEVTPEELTALWEVNVLGAFRVTRAVLPQLRAQGGGHIVQLSSVGGVVGNPGHAAYATTKFALEGMSEALAGEVRDLGIRVTIVEPGPFRTDFAGRSIGRAEPLAAYDETPAGQLRRGFGDQDGQQPNDPVAGARVILAAVADPHSPLRLPLGPEAVQRIRTKLTDQLADLGRWEERLVDTRYANGG